MELSGEEQEMASSHCQRCFEPFGPSSDPLERETSGIPLLLKLREAIVCGDCGGRLHRLCGEGSGGERCCVSGDSALHCLACGGSGAERVFLSLAYEPVREVAMHWVCGLMAGGLLKPDGSLEFHWSLDSDRKDSTRVCELCGLSADLAAANCTEDGCQISAHVACLFKERLDHSRFISRRYFSDPENIRFTPSQRDRAAGGLSSLFREKLQKFQMSMAAGLEILQNLPGHPHPIDYSTLQAASGLKEIFEFTAGKPGDPPLASQFLRLQRGLDASFLCSKHFEQPENDAPVGACVVCDRRTADDLCEACGACGRALEAVSNRRMVETNSSNRGGAGSSSIGLTLFDLRLAAHCHEKLASAGLLGAFGSAGPRDGLLLTSGFDNLARLALQRYFESFMSAAEVGRLSRLPLSSPSDLTTVLSASQSLLSAFGDAAVNRAPRSGAWLRALQAAGKLQPSLTGSGDFAGRVTAIGRLLSDLAPLPALPALARAAFAALSQLASEVASAVQQSRAARPLKSAARVAQLKVDIRELPGYNRASMPDNPLLVALLPKFLEDYGLVPIDSSADPAVIRSSLALGQGEKQVLEQLAAVAREAAAVRLAASATEGGRPDLAFFQLEQLRATRVAAALCELPAARNSSDFINLAHAALGGPPEDDVLSALRRLADSSRVNSTRPKLPLIDEEEFLSRRTALLAENRAAAEANQPASSSLLRLNGEDHNIPGIAEAETLVSEALDPNRKGKSRPLGRWLARADSLPSHFVDEPILARVAGLRALGNFVMSLLGPEADALPFRDALARAARTCGTGGAENVLRALRATGGETVLRGCAEAGPSGPAAAVAVEVVRAWLATKARNFAQKPRLAAFFEAKAAVEILKPQLGETPLPAALAAVSGVEALLPRARKAAKTARFSDLSALLRQNRESKGAESPLAELDHRELCEWIEGVLDTFVALEELFDKAGEARSLKPVVIRLKKVYNLLALAKLSTKSASKVGLPFDLRQNELEGLIRFVRGKKLADCGVPPIEDASALAEEMDRFANRLKGIFANDNTGIQPPLAAILRNSNIGENEKDSNNEENEEIKTTAITPSTTMKTKEDVEALLRHYAAFSPLFRVPFDRLYRFLRRAGELRSSVLSRNAFLSKNLSRGSLASSDVDAAEEFFFNSLDEYRGLPFTSSGLLSSLAGLEQLIVIAGPLARQFDPITAKRALDFIDRLPSQSNWPNLVDSLRRLNDFLSDLLAELEQDGKLKINRNHSTRFAALPLSALGSDALPQTLSPAIGLLELFTEFSELQNPRDSLFSRQSYSKLLHVVFEPQEVSLDEELRRDALKPLRREAKLLGLRARLEGAETSRPFFSRFLEERYRTQLYFPHSDLDRFLFEKAEQFLIASSVASSLFDLSVDMRRADDFDWGVEHGTTDLFPRDENVQLVRRITSRFPANVSESLAGCQLIEPAEIAIIKLALLVQACIHHELVRSERIINIVEAGKDAIGILEKYSLPSDLKEQSVQILSSCSAFVEKLQSRIEKKQTGAQKGNSVKEQKDKEPEHKDSEDVEMVIEESKFDFESEFDFDFGETVDVKKVNDQPEVVGLEVEEIIDDEPQEETPLNTKAEKLRVFFDEMVHKILLSLNKLAEKDAEELGMMFREVHVDLKEYFESEEAKNAQMGGQNGESPQILDLNDLIGSDQASHHDDTHPPENKIALHNLSSGEKLSIVFRNKITANPHTPPELLARPVDLNIFSTKLELNYESLKNVYAKLRMLHLELFLEQSPLIAKVVRRYIANKITFDDIVKMVKAFVEDPGRKNPVPADEVQRKARRKAKEKEKEMMRKQKEQQANLEKRDLVFMDDFFTNLGFDKKQKKIKTKTTEKPEPKPAPQKKKIVGFESESEEEEEVEDQPVETTSEQKLPSPGSLLALNFPRANSIYFSEPGQQIVAENCTFYCCEDAESLSKMCSIDRPPYFVLGKYTKPFADFESEILQYNYMKTLKKDQISKTVFVGFVFINPAMLSRDFLRCFADGLTFGYSVSQEMNFYLGHFSSCSLSLEELGFVCPPGMESVDFNRLFIFFLKPKPPKNEKFLTYTLELELKDYPETLKNSLERQSTEYKSLVAQARRNPAEFRKIFGLPVEPNDNLPDFISSDPPIGLKGHRIENVSQVSETTFENRSLANPQNDDGFVFECANPEKDELEDIKGQLRELVQSFTPEELVNMYRSVDDTMKKVLSELVAEADKDKREHFAKLLGS